MGSHVTVTNLANGRTVQVRINDRGPSRRTGKIIDLSYGASRVIGMGGDVQASYRALQNKLRGGPILRQFEKCRRAVRYPKDGEII
jgi:rare lipoprotein A